jgi:hypothetical protein
MSPLEAPEEMLGFVRRVIALGDASSVEKRR